MACLKQLAETPDISEIIKMSKIIGLMAENNSLNILVGITSRI